MSFDIEESVREGIIVLHLHGRLIVGQPVTDLRAKITELAVKGTPNVVLDMTNVDYIDSTGLGGMVIGHTSLKKAGGALKLLNLNRRGMELLVLTKLNTVFPAFDDEISAVNSFFPGREIKKFDILQFVQDHKDENSLE